MFAENAILGELRELKSILPEYDSLKETGFSGSFCINSFSENSDIDILIEPERPD
jgi:predicted nucleotidyltransferase